MKVFVKEQLFVLDYNDNIVDCIFNSDRHNVPGYAYEINIKDANTGYSDLSFKMPSHIIDADGVSVINPKLAYLVPLTKLRYTRQVRYTGEERIAIPNPDGSVTYYDHNDLMIDYMTGKTTYVMDYIVQPLDKGRSSIKVDLTFTAIDFPRFNLSKKKLGLTFDQDTITTADLSLYKNEPLSVPGSVQYIKWDNTLATNFQITNEVASPDLLGTTFTPSKGDIWHVISNNKLYQYDGVYWNQLGSANDLTTWSPNAQAGTYPLTEAAIKKLVEQTDFSYGILATIYYWPITETGRFEGVLYEKGGYITLSLYNTYEGSDWEGSEYLDSITWRWNYLNKMEHYLGPNNACNYLRYILKDTNWTVKGDKLRFVPNTTTQPWFIYPAQPSGTGFVPGQYFISREYDSYNDEYIFHVFVRQESNLWIDESEKTIGQIINLNPNDAAFGTLYDIDIEQKEVARSAQASVGQNILKDVWYSLSVSNSNCYNAITSEAKQFDLYPVFDCEDKTVTLKLNAGADFKLMYRYGRNLKSSSVKADGEKVITKLYATGGQDAQGSSNITIGEATRNITGAAPFITSTSLNNYNPTNLKNTIKSLQQDAYNHLRGVSLTVNLNMNNKEFRLEFPDNLYEKYLTNFTQSNLRVHLITFNTGNYIDLLYNPTGVDYCFYIYDTSGNYTDETKQLYKFDYASRSLRRNLDSYISSNIGTITAINTAQAAQIQGGAGIVATYMKYTPTLNNAISITDNNYYGYAKDILTDPVYNITLSGEGNFVLVGPNRVYNIPADEETTSQFSVGNYYYFASTNKYYYCTRLVTDDTTAQGKVNRIVINGYVFLEMGSKSTILKIRVNNTTNASVITNEGHTLTLEDWFVNGYSIRVKFVNNNLIEISSDEFDPNAEEYLIGRSPYGTSYIYNFKYLYDNGWMTKEQILDIYRVNNLINNLNLDFYNRYTKALVNIRAAYNDAVNNEELYSTKADAQLEALMSQYWVNPNQATKGEFSAFPGVPLFSDGGSAASHYDSTRKMYWENITYGVNDQFVKKVWFNVFNSAGTNSLYPYSTDNKTTNDNPHGEGQYHVVAKALGWDNYVANRIPINKHFTDYTKTQDPSETVPSYNDFIDDMKEYYYRALVADNTITETAAQLAALQAEYDEWQEEIENYERYLQENYGQYIIEGSYNNTEQPYANLLFNEALEASDKYATPDITYTLKVVDSTGLFEYRNPNVVICNDLIKKLHGMGQIVPRVGDYVAVYDKDIGMFGVPGLITGITRRLDDPMQNDITIDTSYSDADELVGNIITATNTVLNNKDIYGRAAIINNKGQLSSTTVSNALSTGSNNITIVSNNGKIEVNDNGLTCANPSDNSLIMRYNGTGILGSSNGGVTWRELLTQNGINANYINSGTINASRVSITDGQYDVTSLTADGLLVKTAGGRAATIGYIDNNLEPQGWSDNVAVFVGKDANGNGIGYFTGYINANKGGNIAGWKITSDRLSSGTGSNYVALCSSGDYRLWAGNATASSAPFSIKQNGALKAGNADITGKITVTDANSTVNNGTVGGWTASNTGLKVSGIELSPNGGTSHVVNGRTGTDWSLWANNNFGVTTNGNLYATGVDVSGAITATSGTIGGCTISNGVLQIKNANIDTLSVSKITGGNNSANITFDGNIYCNKLYASNSGKIGGWTIGSNSLTAGSTTISSSGKISFSSGSGAYYFSMGDGTNHPACSSLNVASNGAIDFGGGGLYVDGNAGELKKASTANSVTVSGTAGVYINGNPIVLNTSDLQTGGKSGWTGNFKVDFPGMTGYYRLWFINGILVDKEEG